MSRRRSYLRRPSGPPPLIGYFANWNMFDPRKLRPVSMEPRRAVMTVITPTMENTPIVMPNMVSPERSLFTPSEPSETLMTSCQFMEIAECGMRECGVAMQGREPATARASC